MTAPARYEPGRLEQVALDLFHGWGYAFYRDANRLRADDLLVRAKAGDLLGQARAAVEAAEAEYRRVHLPPPSRARPRPDPEAVAAAKVLERLGRDIGALVGRIAALPAPEGDRMSLWLRDEAATLAVLRDHDLRLVGRAEALRALVAGRDGAALLAEAPLAEDLLAGLAETLRARADALAG
ncbi:hypothetical protein [Lichenibacterium dinghuense]|uniref:hypothetical protein n=1 Tax=Lichenibacterium dinghuense TaxID=2895977 RepID=UPI001F214EED|nr:hypothetical protein [Lichenibacterium sp. 6Y81]